MAKVSLTGTAKSEMDFITADGKINMENLTIILDSIKADAEKSNAGNTAAGRRFRNNTNMLTTEFRKMRAVSPKAGKK